MIIRRIVNNFKKQDYLSLCLDFAVVAAGIFFGLLVTEWNDGRIDKIQERKLVERLYDEVTLSIKENSQIKLKLEESAELGNLCLQKIYNKTLSKEQADNFVNECFLPHMFGDVEIDGKLSLPTLVEIVDSGAFQTISNQAVRSSISKYIVMMDQSKEQEVFIRDLFLPSLIFFQQNLRSRPGYKLNIKYEITADDLMTNEQIYNHFNNTYTLRNFGLITFARGIELNANYKAY